MSYKETISALRSQLNEIDEQRAGLVATKKEVEAEQAQITVEIRRNKSLPRDRFNKLLKRQGELNLQQSMIDAKLGQYSANKHKINVLIDECKSNDNNKAEVRDEKWSNVREALVDIKTKYTDFSTDGTRVASMRLMASKFVEEIDAILRMPK